MIIILILIGFGIVLYSTVWGAALSDDSYDYISSARNLLAGRGFDSGGIARDDQGRIDPGPG